MVQVVAEEQLLPQQERQVAQLNLVVLEEAHLLLRVEATLVTAVHQYVVEQVALQVDLVQLQHVLLEMVVLEVKTYQV